MRNAQHTTTTHNHTTEKCLIDDERHASPDMTSLEHLPWLDLTSPTSDQLKEPQREQCTPGSERNTIGTIQVQRDETSPRNEPEDALFFDIPTNCPTTASKRHESWYGNQHPRENGIDQDFAGYCIGTGAAKSVVGTNQYTALCTSLQYRLKLRPSKTNFKFGSSTFGSRGTFTTRIRVNDDQFIQVEVDIVNYVFTYPVPDRA